MSAAAINFDTLKFTQEMEDAGMPKKQAQALAKAQMKVFTRFAQDTFAGRFEKIDERFEKIDERFVEQDKKLTELSHAQQNLSQQIENLAENLPNKIMLRTGGLLSGLMFLSFVALGLLLKIH